MLAVTDDKQKCLSGLFQTNPLDDLNTIRKAKKKLDRTCEWLLLREEYVNWVSGEGPWLLRLEGAPGIGKTVLATFLVNELTKRAKTTRCERSMSVRSGAISTIGSAACSVLSSFSRTGAGEAASMVGSGIATIEGSVIAAVTAP